MEDFGFVSGTFKSKAGTKKANEELNKMKKAHDKNLKKWAKDKERIDLTNINVYTIDNKNTRVRDDAMSYEKLDNGHVKITVHITDICDLIPQNSLLDKDAHANVKTIQIGSYRKPMLPQ